MKRTAAFACVFALIAGIIGMNISFTDASAYSASDLEKAVENAVSWKEDNDSLFSSPGTKSADYYAIALARAGASFDSTSYLDSLDKIAGDYDTYSSTLDMQRTLLTAAALGGDAEYIGGRDLVADSTYFRAASAPLGQQGIMGYIGALTALDAGGYEVPSDWAYADREDMITSILAAQEQNGSFDNDVFVTASAIIALSNYNDLTEYNITRAYDGAKTSVSCAGAISDTLTYLSSVQEDTAAFGDLTETAFVSLAMDSIGLSQDDERLKKDGETVVDALLEFQNSDGGFADEVGGKSDSLSTSYALCAAVSALRVSEGKNAFFDFTSNDGISVGSAVSISSTATTRPSATTRPKASSSPSRTASPKTSSSPKSSSTPAVKTPKPAQKPDLIGPVQQIGPPAPSPTPTIPADEEEASSAGKILKMTIAATVLALLIVLLLTAVTLYILKKKNIIFTEPAEKKPTEIYHAKSHLKIDEREKYKQYEKYKTRGKYKGSRR